MTKYEIAAQEARLAQEHSDLLFDRYLKAHADWVYAADQTFAAYDRVHELVKELEQELDGLPDPEQFAQ